MKEIYEMKGAGYSIRDIARDVKGGGKVDHLDGLTA